MHHREITPVLIGQDPKSLEESNVNEIPVPIIETYSLHHDTSDNGILNENDESMNNLEDLKDVPEDEEPGFVESVELRPEDLEEPIPRSGRAHPRAGRAQLCSLL